MSDIEERFKKVEGQIDLLSSNMGTESIDGKASYIRSEYGASDEIDLLELVRFFWQKKLTILIISLFFAVLGISYSLYLPNMYRASTLLVPTEQEGGGLSGLASQYGGLAAMAGINLGGGDSSKSDQALALAMSWPFVTDFVKKYDLKPLVMAVESWNQKTGELVFDESLFDSEADVWKSKKGKTLEPSSWEVYQEFLKMAAIDLDSKTGIFQLSVKHKSPILAAEWAVLYVKELNLYFQQRDMQEAKQNIAYLKAEIEKTNVTMLQERLHGLIETQMQTLMLSEVSDEYLLKTLVPSLIPEEKISPKRALIVVLFVFIGGFLAIVYLLITNVIKKVSVK